MSQIAQIKYDEAIGYIKGDMERLSKGKRKASGTKALETKIEELVERRHQIDADVWKLTRELQELCTHPVKYIICRRYATHDTLGCIDGEHRSYTCSICKDVLWEGYDYD